MYVNLDNALLSAGDLQDPAADLQETDQRLYSYVDNRTRGGANKNWQEGNKLTMMTEDELRKEFNASDNDELQRAFGSFDNYLAYMNERESLIDEGVIRADWWNDEDGGYGAMAEVLTPLFEQYASPEAKHYTYAGNLQAQNQDGDGYVFNGSSWIKTSKVDDHAGFGDYLKMAAIAVATSVAAGPLAAQLAPVLGVSTNVATGIAVGIVDAAKQAVLEGGVDFGDALKSGILSWGMAEGIDWVAENADSLSDTIQSSIGGEVTVTTDQGVQNFDVVYQGGVPGVNTPGGWQSLDDFTTAAANAGATVDSVVNAVTSPEWVDAIVDSGFGDSISSGLGGILETINPSDGRFPTIPPTTIGDVEVESEKETEQEEEVENPEDVEDNPEVVPEPPPVDEPPPPVDEPPPTNDDINNPDDDPPIVIPGTGGDASDPENPDEDPLPPFPGQDIDPDYNDGEDEDPPIVIPEEPPPTSAASGGDGMLSGAETKWSELFAYTSITPQQAAKLAPYKDMIQKGRGMFS